LEAVRPFEEEEEALPLEELPEGGEQVLGSESSVEEIFQAAQSFLAQGNLRDAEALARRAQELAPSPDTQALLKRAESALLAELKENLLDVPRVPSLMVPPPHLKTLPLSAPERYLLSRIDGKRDLAAFLHQSPLQSL